MYKPTPQKKLIMELAEAAGDAGVSIGAIVNEMKARGASHYSNVESIQRLCLELMHENTPYDYGMIKPENRTGSEWVLVQQPEPAWNDYSHELEVRLPKDFCSKSACRFRTDGAHSAQAFREELLVPAIKRANALRVLVHIDFGELEDVPADFIEEAFGGLIREHGFTADDLELLAVDSSLKTPVEYGTQIFSYIKEADISKQIRGR